MGRGGQRVQLFNHKMNKFWGCNVQHGVTTVNNVHLKVANRVDFKTWHYTKIFVTIWGNGCIN